MAVTKICANKRLVAGSVTTTEIADLAVTTGKINDLAVTTDKIANLSVTTPKLADKAVTPVKVDETGSYTVANIIIDSDAGDNNKVTIGGDGSITTQGGELNVQNVAGDTSFLKVDNTGAVTTNNTLGVGTDLSVGGNAVIEGNLTVNGTTTSVNSTDTDITDKNITINKNGTEATSVGAGLTVEKTDGVDGSFVYDSALTTKWKIGDVGSEVEIVDISSAQTLSNKTILLKNGDIQGAANYEDAIRALDAAVNTGDAYNTIETDTSDVAFTNGNTLTLPTPVLASSVLKVFESGMRLRSGVSNDYTIDYTTGVITFADDPCSGANLIVEYIPA